MGVVNVAIALAYTAGLYNADSLVSKWGNLGFGVFVVLGGMIVCEINGVRFI